MPSTTPISLSMPRSASIEATVIKSSHGSQLETSSNDQEGQAQAQAELREITVLSGPTLKAVRAHARDKQRSKKAGDRARSRMTNVFAISKAGGPGGVSVSDVSVGLGKPEEEKRAVLADSFWVREETERQQLKEHEEGITAGALNPSEEREVQEGRIAKEVKLLDLVRIKPSKQRGSVRDDFEVIPSIRSVIVLDEWTEDPKNTFTEPEEPWEYISADESSSDSDTTRAPSYAEVVSKA